MSIDSNNNTSDKSAIHIRHATENDYMLIAELGAKTFYETWRPVNTEEDMQKYISEAFDPEYIRASLVDEKTNTYLIAFLENVPIGYVKLRRDRTYDEFNGDKVIELERIYIDSAWQYKSIGRMLMDESIKLATDEQNEWLWLGVNIDNKKAIPFYKKYGFEIFGEKSFQLGDAIDSDLLMKLKLPI